jgi:hypothetical protein
MNARPEFVTIFLPVTSAMRARLEQTIEALVALLDEIDGDADLEPGVDDEPSLGWTYGFDGSPAPVRDDCDDDRELDLADDEDGGDREPWLGWRGDGRGAWGDEGTDDREDEPEHLEDNGDREPPGGWGVKAWQVGLVERVGVGKAGRAVADSSK